MKNIILVLLLLISANALCMNESGKSTIANDTIVFRPSLLQMEFRWNGNVVESRKINIEENDVLTVVIKNVLKMLGRDYTIKQVDIVDLSSAIKFGTISIPKSEYDLETTDVTFTITNLEQGKSYKFLVMYKETIQDYFYVVVDEIIHFEINIGPFFSGMPKPDFVETPITKDNSGNADTVMINNHGTNSQLTFAIGGVFHPWGYNPRAKISLRNTFIYLGFPLSETIGENFLLGLGFGYRGISLIGGIHIGKIKRLADGYTLNTRYPKSDFDLEKAKVNDIKIHPFAGITLDLSIVGKLFSGLTF